LGDAKQGGNLVENDNVARSGDASYGNEEEFVVAKYEKLQEASVVPVNVEREGLCSYSSLAAFAHGDAGTEIQALNVVPIASESEDEETPNLENSGDADKATALGSAFHTLAQRATIMKADDGCLAAPSKDAIEAQTRTFELTELQRQRLDAAIDRWLNSDIAANFFASGHVSAEVPFTVCIPDEQAQKGCDGSESQPVVKEFYLEGEIDALSINEDSAWIIDYKTGGNASEAAEALQKKAYVSGAVLCVRIVERRHENHKSDICES